MVKGEVTIVKRDAITNEVKETIVKENTTTYFFPWSILTRIWDALYLENMDIGIGLTKRTTKEISTKAYFTPDVAVTLNAGS